MIIRIQIKHLAQITFVMLFGYSCNVPPKKQTSGIEKKIMESPIRIDTLDAVQSEEIEKQNPPKDTTLKKKLGKRYYLLNACNELSFTGVNFFWNDEPQKGDVSISIYATYRLDYLTGSRTGPFGINFRFAGDERIGLKDLGLTHQETYYLSCYLSESGLVPHEVFKNSDEIPGKLLISHIVVELKDNMGRLHWIKTNDIYQNGIVN